MPKDTIFTLIKNLKDQKSLEVEKKIRSIADLNTNFLIYGETGVGKDFWVNYLFSISRFPGILNLNCGDVPESLLESEWFGYKKGAFTGADRDYEGKWRKAQGGILFLNQVDLLSINLQSRLLRIIERKKYFPLGSNQEVDIDVRFVFSADHDIEEKVQREEFRQDLFYRIASYSILVPPLRERKRDILPLLHYFADQKGVQVNLSPKAVNTLLAYPWRGNIREIENFVNNVAIMKGELTDGELGLLIKDSSHLFETIKKPEMSLQELEKEYISFLLQKYKSKVRVAEILDISRKALYNKLKKYEQD
jgi:transcriptional regulator with PAS, ATPase and Fis domain